MQQIDENRVPLWLDCDPGHDDAFAILLAAYHPNLKLLGISTVHGNASLTNTTNNALSILAAIGKDTDPEIRVVPGAAKPFCRPAVFAPSIHGETGLDGTDLLPKRSYQDQNRGNNGGNAITEIRKALLNCPPQTAWLVATGTLTNIALLFAVYPEVAAHIKGLSIMGGAIGDGFSSAPLGCAPPEYTTEDTFTPTPTGTGKGSGSGSGSGVKEARIGNRTPWAEFNISCDPEAAQSIFSNPVLASKTWLIPLDVTHQACVGKSVQDLLLWGTTTGDTKREGKSPSRLRKMFHELLVFFESTYRDRFGLVDGPPLHDPIAVAVLLGGDELHNNNNKLNDSKGYRVAFACPAGERWKVEVCLEGKQIGRTIATLCSSNSHGGIRIPRSLDLEAFWAALEMCMAKADRAVASTFNAII